jgi:hypothetical protein
MFAAIDNQPTGSTGFGNATQPEINVDIAVDTEAAATAATTANTDDDVSTAVQLLQFSPGVREAQSSQTQQKRKGKGDTHVTSSQLSL